MAEYKYFGVWTEEEFRDTLIIAGAVALVTFTTTIFYRWLSKWLETHDRSGSG